MQSEATEASARSPHVTSHGAGILIALLAAAVYLPALATGFNADDYLILWRIKTIDGLAAPLEYFKFAFYEYFRPVGFLSFALDWRIWDLNPFGFHLTNVCLHAGNVLLVFVLARRLLAAREAAVAALLFGLHPASHEAVYWIAARFDLLATFFVLMSLWALGKPGVRWQVAGTLTFALALLAKESAIALLIIAPAWDALIARRDWRTTAVRAAPLALVVILYSAARSLGADLDAAGGMRRLPKLLMMLAGVSGILWLAWRKGRSAPTSSRAREMTPLAAGGAVVVAVLMQWEGVSRWALEKLEFLRHVLFYSISPIVIPAPSPESFTSPSALAALPSAVFFLFLALWALHVVWAARARDERAFIVIFIAAALLPISSMTGGLRYLYLPSVGVALLMAAMLPRLPKIARAIGFAVVAIVLAVSIQQILQAGRAWRAASTMTRDGVLLMAGSITRCNEDDVLLLTTPVAIGDVYANLPWEAFDVLANCAPRSTLTLLRVLRSDVRVAVTNPDSGTIELRVPDYAGNIVASADLRNFTVWIEPGERATVQTTAGLLRTFPDGTSQVFQLTMTPEARAAKRFYYSDGRIRQ